MDNKKTLSPESLKTLKAFSREGDGGFRCNKSQADDLARAIQEALALLAANDAAEVQS